MMIHKLILVRADTSDGWRYLKIELRVCCLFKCAYVFSLLGQLLMVGEIIYYLSESFFIKISFV